MSDILRQLPFSETETTAAAPGGEVVAVRPYQIILWVSLSVDEVLGEDAPRFPAILDTGTNHNFIIRQDQLERWAGLPASALVPSGQVYLGKQALPLLEAGVWIHPNQAGQRDAFARKRPFPLELEQGIIVYPHSVPTAGRLPLLGLRALVGNRLRLTVDGDKRLVTLRSP